MSFRLNFVYYHPLSLLPPPTRYLEEELDVYRLVRNILSNIHKLLQREINPSFVQSDEKYEGVFSPCSISGP